MDCREFLLRYSDYDDSLISPHEADRFRAHMAGCPSCARYDRVLRKGRMVARQLAGPEPGPEFASRLRMRLLHPRPERRVPGARLAAGLAAATVMLVAAASVQLLDRSAGGTGAPALAEAVVSAGPKAPAGAGRVAARLPATPMRPRAWASEEVAPADAASYSPLTMGPPAYRADAPSGPATTDLHRRALD